MREKKKKPRFKVGQRVWFLKSMRMCTAVTIYDEPYQGQQAYSVEVMDSGKRMFVPERGLEACEPTKREADEM